MKHAKMLAILAVAVFCVSAFAIAIDTTDSSADGEKLTYSFYLQFKEGENSYSARLADVEVAGAEPTGALYESALTAACEAAGLNIVFGAYNMITSIEAGGHVYAGSDYGDWGSDHYYNFSVYIIDENKAWKSSSLNDSTMFAIVFDKYAFSEPADASKYYYVHDPDYPAYDCWTILPTAAIVDYKIYIQCNDDDGTTKHSFSKWIYSTQIGMSGNSLKSARVLGAKAAGFTIVNGSGQGTSVASVTADGYTYAKHGTYGEADYWGYSAYYEVEGNKWSDLQKDNLTETAVISHVFDNYKMEDPKDSSYFYHEPMGTSAGYWTKLPSVLPNGEDANKGGNNNTVLYIAIGAVAVVAVATIAFFVLKKKA